MLQHRTETWRTRPLSEKRPIVGRSKISECKALSVDHWSGQLMGGRTLLPAVTRTMQYAADIAALLRWRLAMTRAVLPHTSAREQRLLSVLVEKNWLAPPLDGGGDDDADVGNGHNLQQYLMTMTSPFRIKKTRSQTLMTFDHRAQESLWEDPTVNGSRVVGPRRQGRVWFTRSSRDLRCSFFA